jgi:hypothetical protein
VVRYCFTDDEITPHCGQEPQAFHSQPEPVSCPLRGSKSR